MKAGLVQMAAAADLAANVATAGRLVGEAARQGCGLVVLPEMWAFLPPAAERGGIRAWAERHQEALAATMSGWAAAHRLCLVGGTIFVPAPGEAARVCNRTLVHGPDGRELARYDKVHLFDPAPSAGLSGFSLESAYARAGASLAVFRHGGFCCGLSVCYDLRFPELYRRLVEAGAEVLLVPAAFSARTGRDHWEPLLRARAIEDQCFILGCGQHGEPGGTACHGHSMAVDPWGRILSCLPQGEGVVVADLDRALLDRVRRDLPALAHRRDMGGLPLYCGPEVSVTPEP